MHPHMHTLSVSLTYTQFQCVHTSCSVTLGRAFPAEHLHNAETKAVIWQRSTVHKHWITPFTAERSSFPVTHCFLNAFISEWQNRLLSRWSESILCLPNQPRLTASVALLVMQQRDYDDFFCSDVVVAVSRSTVCVVSVVPALHSL